MESEIKKLQLADHIKYIFFLLLLVFIPFSAFLGVKYVFSHEYIPGASRKNIASYLLKHENLNVEKEQILIAGGLPNDITLPADVFFTARQRKNILYWQRFFLSSEGIPVFSSEKLPLIKSDSKLKVALGKNCIAFTANTTPVRVYVLYPAVVYRHQNLKNKLTFKKSEIYELKFPEKHIGKILLKWEKKRKNFQLNILLKTPKDLVLRTFNPELNKHNGFTVKKYYVKTPDFLTRIGIISDIKNTLAKIKKISKLY